MSYTKIILDIKGMHCRSCEIILEENISKIDGVRKARLNYKKGIAEIEYQGQLDRRMIETAIRGAGYEPGKEDKSRFFSRNLLDYLELMAAGLILFVLYLILKIVGAFELSANISPTQGLLGVFIVGLTAGISTCMALIGGLVLGISSHHAELHREATTGQKFRPHIFFNLGRLFSYIFLGGIIGLLGSVLSLSAGVLGALTMVIGGIMLLLGLKLT